jgi:hypothetical protein
MGLIADKANILRDISLEYEKPYEEVCRIYTQMSKLVYEYNWRTSKELENRQILEAKIEKLTREFFEK